MSEIPVDVLMLRHGRTDLNAQGRLSGHGDHAIDDHGLTQARAAARVIAEGYGSPTIVSSPLKRCLQTAGEVDLACGGVAGEVHVDDRFVEMNYGEWEAKPLADISLEVWREWQADPNFSPPGGETLAQVTERVTAGLIDWSERVEGPLVVVSHVSPIKAGVVWALDVGESITWRMRLDNASITRLAVKSQRATLLSFNETAHLGHLEVPDVADHPRGW